MPKITKNIKLLSIGFLLVFFSFNGIQQYVTTYFQYLNLREVGFTSLLLLYITFTVFGLFCGRIVSKIGAKRSMFLTTIFYALYCFALLTATREIIYIASIFLGAAGALLWIAQNTYLVRASDKSACGTNAGYFSTTFAIGTASGILLLGWIIPIVGFYKSFLIFASIPILAIFVFARMNDIRGETTDQKRRSMMPILKSPTALRMVAVWFPFNFVQGLVIGIVPLTIVKVFGTVQAIGILTAFFYITPLLSAYILGRLSDKVGRERMVTAMYVLSFIGVGLLFFANNPVLLIAAIVVLAGNFGLSRTITFAMVGDIAPAKNVEDFSALTWTIQGISFVSALLFSALFEGPTVYLIVCGGIVLSYLLFWPLRKLPFAAVQQHIEKELLSKVG